MVFRRRPSTPEPAPLRPEWQRRFDAAAEIIRSQPGPDWIDDRLAAHEAALRSAEVDDRRLAASIERLRPDATAAELEQALRRRGPTPSRTRTTPSSARSWRCAGGTRRPTT